MLLPGVPASAIKGAGKLAFKTGASAEKYLRRLVKGIPKGMKTSKDWRYIDAFAKGIAHESKVGYVTATKFIKKQADKDALLLKNKQVKRVVWHFYKSGITGKKGPSKNLAKYLKARGIIYVVH